MAKQTVEFSTRVAWADVPEQLQREVARICGAEIVDVQPILTGFSPGLVASVELHDGRTMFVKACSGSLNQRTPTMHAAESEVVRLAAPRPAPELIGTLSWGDWSGIVTGFVAGSDVSRALALGAHRADVSDPALKLIDRAYAVCDQIASDSTSRLGSHVDVLERDFLWFGIRKLIDRDGSLPSELEDLGNDRLIHLESLLPAVLHGDRLVHGDLRADNVVIANSSGDVAVDWPAAALGNPLFDAVLLAGSLALAAPSFVARIAGRSELIRRADSEALDVMLAGFIGHYRWSSTLGSPPGIPGVRAYQASLAAVFEHWLRLRVERRD